MRSKRHGKTKIPHYTLCIRKVEQSRVKGDTVACLITQLRQIMSQVHVAPHVCATPAATTTAAARTAAQAPLDSVEDATEKLKIKTHFKHVRGLLAVEDPPVFFNPSPSLPLSFTLSRSVLPAACCWRCVGVGVVAATLTDN